MRKFYTLRNDLKSSGVLVLCQVPHIDDAIVYLLTSPAELEAERRRAWDAARDFACSGIENLWRYETFADYLKTVEGEE